MDPTKTHGSVSPLGRWKRRFQRFRSIRIFRWLPAGARRSSKRSVIASLAGVGYVTTSIILGVCKARCAFRARSMLPEIHDGSGLPTQQLSLVRRVRTPPMTRLRWPYRSGIRLGRRPCRRRFCRRLVRTGKFRWIDDAGATNRSFCSSFKSR
jgi:hypothetical protein